MDLRLGHEINIRSHQAGRFTLTNERRRSRDDGLSTGHVQSLEEEPSEMLDDPLHNSEIIEHLHERDEEDDSGELFPALQGQKRALSSPSTISAYDVPH